MVHSSVVPATDMKGGTQLCSRAGTGILSQQQPVMDSSDCVHARRLTPLYSRRCEHRDAVIWMCLASETIAALIWGEL